MTNQTRLIEVAFPLKQASLDSVREKYGPKGHISGFHLWPARRPLAASRAVLILTLLRDPGNTDERKRILDALAGRVVETTKRKRMPNGRTEDVVAEETIGGILRWGRESNPELDWFRSRIRDAYDGCAPSVLDPFAGGGAIPFEAMRLGCEATAIDINPVAWFILKCTLEYPHRFAGRKRPIPSFALQDREFTKEFLKTQGLKGATLRTQLEKLGLDDKSGGGVEHELPGMSESSIPLEADLAWHVRAWGRWVLERARADLERFYPVVDGKPTVAYLWARTVKCKHCRATLPLLKTRWLCRKDNKRVVLTMEPNTRKTGIVFGIQTDVPVVGTNAAQRREHDKRIGGGTMSRAGASCPCCGQIMTMEDLRLEGRAGRLGTEMTAIVVDGGTGREYRLPTERERQVAVDAAKELESVFADIPFGIPKEALAGKEALGFRVPLYGFDKWYKLFTPRQLRALGTLVLHIRSARCSISEEGYPVEWVEAITAYLASSLDRLVDHSTSLATWYLPGENVKHTFVRYALPITWDFAESNTIYEGGGSWSSAVSFCSAALDHALRAGLGSSAPTVFQSSATTSRMPTQFDLVVTDPPYYDAIPYSDLMDCFYVWLRRSTWDLGPDYLKIRDHDLSPKWDDAENDGELIDDASRHGGDATRSKAIYEDGMFRAFQTCHRALKPEGRMVIVFAHKQPDAWETLVSAMIRAGFVVDASWPIQTENVTRSRARASAALSSSVWLVCRKRPETARPGWDNRVLHEMRENITTRLRDFWDAGIRGPDFVWAATGPALEAYSKHPIVKKADEPGQVMTVSEFLGHVRRIVVDFVVGRVLSGNGEAEAVTGLDDVTTYYLLHRYHFKMGDAPVGACILYAVSCGLSDGALADQFDLLVRTGGQEAADEDEGEETDGEVVEGSGSKVKLKQWHHRKRRGMGYEAVGGRPVPLIDQVHRLMMLWKAGDVGEVDDYLDSRGLRRSALFHQILQALIELAEAGSEERPLLESISNYVGTETRQERLL